LKGNIHIFFSFAALAVVFLTAKETKGAKNFSKEK